MQYPNEGLEFEPVDPPKPAPVARASGVVEVLQPIARPEKPPDPPPALPRPWYQNPVAIAGAFAVVVLGLLGGVFLGKYASPAKFSGPSADVARTEPDTDRQIADAPPVAEDEDEDEPADDPDTGSIIASNAPFTARLAARRKPARPRARERTYRPRLFEAAVRPRRRLPRPKFLISDFVPTTLVIYIDRGQIKTRTEPSPTAAYKKQTTSPD
jgi:hypothetical protein